MLNDDTKTNDEIIITKNGNVVRGVSDGVGANSTSKLTTRIVLRDSDGNIKEERTLHNTVTVAGKSAIADQILASPTLGKPGWMAIGTGTPSGTALGAELNRVALTSKSRSGSVVTFQGDWAAGSGTGALTEAGIFDAASAGNMWASQSFSVINKGASDILSISWTLTIS